MDRIIEKFIIKNNIDLKKIRTIPEWDLCKIKDKNNLAEKYGIYKNRKTIKVSVVDIIGYDYEYCGGTKDLIHNMKNFFQEDGDGYHTRANGMLDYTSDNVLEKLNYSFIDEPIVLNEVDGNYFISTNGMHRFHVMRLLCLSELMHANSEDERKKIKEKYKIEAKVNNLDYIKTYCNFILSELDSSYWLSNEYDSNYNKTGKTKVEIHNEKIVMTDEELIEFTLKKINEKEFNTTNLEYFKLLLQYNCDNIPSFNIFIDNYFSDFTKGRSYK